MLRRIFARLKESKSVKPPKAKKQDYALTQFGETRNDPYHWMRDENWQEVLHKPDVLKAEIREYLEAENKYAEDQFKKCEALTKEIGDELAARIVPDDSSVPAKDGNFEYWTEFRKGADYPIYLRRKTGSEDRDIIFNEEEEAKKHEFFDVAQVSHSPDHKYIAYAVDTKGSEYYDVRIRNLETGEEFAETIPLTDGGIIWSEDSQTIFYVEKDNNHRSKNLKMHHLGTDPKTDKTIYHEKNDGYNLGASKTRSGKYIMIHSGDSETNQTSFFDSNDKDPKPKVIRPFEKGVLYSVYHHDDMFYIQTNKDGATEYKIMSTLVENYADDNWSEYLPHRDDVTIEGLIVLKDYMVRIERENALNRIIVDDYQGNEFELKVAEDAAYDLSAYGGLEYDTHKIRVDYETMADPGRLFEVDLKTGDKKVIKETTLPNGHDPKEYIVERFDITARDGEQIPVTLLRHKSVKPDGTAPLHQYGYGSYGIDAPSGFSRNAISIVDRGAVYAVAHIRGGGDKGEKWHHAGKKKTKMNTFTDFIDVTEALIKRGYGQQGEVSMEGRSAGGMLMGGVVNMRPDLYGSVIAGVAFVDVLSTISDGTLPLTPGEWEEWGNPITDRDYYDLLKSYSPYDNIQKKTKYPMIIAPAGLTDPRVTYWEPAKWIARLRDEAKGGPFLLKMNMGSGHFGSSARYDVVRERADEYAMCIQRWADRGYDMRLRVNYPEQKSDAPKPSAGNQPK